MAAMAFESLVLLACIAAYVICRNRHPRPFTCAVPLMAAIAWVLVRVCMHAPQELRFSATVACVLICWWCSGSLVLHVCTSVRARGVSSIACLGCVLAICVAVCPLVPAVAVAAGWKGAVLLCANVPGACSLWFSLSIVALDRYARTHRGNPEDRIDAIIVPGAALRGNRPSPFLISRLDRALELWRSQGCCAHIVVSGGQGADECVSEVAAMRRYLEERDVPGELIIDEDRSTTTRENMRFSRRLIEERLGTGARIAVVSTDYHLPRCTMYAAAAGLSIIGVGASSARRAWSRGYIRESAALTQAILPTYAIPMLIALICMS